MTHGNPLGDEDRPDAHERKVIDEEDRATGEPTSSAPEGSENRYTGAAGESSYEAEVEAERQGTTADEVEREEDEPAGEAARWYTG
jgi:hypothetical protein